MCGPHLGQPSCNWKRIPPPWCRGYVGLPVRRLAGVLAGRLEPTAVGAINVWTAPWSTVMQLETNTSALVPRLRWAPGSATGGCAGWAAGADSCWSNKCVDRTLVNRHATGNEYLRLGAAVTLGSRFGDWRVCWLGGWSRH